MTKIIGITGGIASGKSLVSHYLETQGYPIVDADVVAREVVARGSVGLKRIEEEFGQTVIDADGQLARKRLGQIVFADHGQLRRLNAIMQPLIRERIVSHLNALREQGAKVAFLVAPLLFEQSYQSLCDEIVVVYVSPQTQLQRLMQRDQLTQSAAQERINAQWPLKQKVQQADVIINNDEGPDQTLEQVAAWLKRTIA